MRPPGSCQGEGPGAPWRGGGGSRCQVELPSPPLSCPLRRGKGEGCSQPFQKGSLAASLGGPQCSQDKKVDPQPLVSEAEDPSQLPRCACRFWNKLKLELCGPC
ncbi:unnamed protein product [Pipistrellus nathusii]|uniref:Uncharacterized protein n=1 Tax=Pipistrellus nathusii TaxID=59473 RepID=A0ABN9ZH55_PIPNA